MGTDWGFPTLPEEFGGRTKPETMELASCVLCLWGSSGRWVRAQGLMKGAAALGLGQPVPAGSPVHTQGCHLLSIRAHKAHLAWKKIIIK